MSGILSKIQEKFGNLTEGNSSLNNPSGILTQLNNFRKENIKLGTIANDKQIPGSRSK